jgi:hypothetical protein
MSKGISELDIDINGGASNGNDTAKVVVAAADRLRFL